MLVSFVSNLILWFRLPLSCVLSSFSTPLCLEICHFLQGALHNAEDNEIYDPSYYDGSNLGYIDRRNCFRTIMSYPDHVGCRNAGCSGGSCSIVMYFSNTVATYNGHPTGNSRTNNAKYIDSKGRKSSSWK